jgi:hypothetical protein
MLFTHVKKNSSPKDLQKKSDIPNLPTGVVVRNKRENRFQIDIKYSQIGIKYLTHMILNKRNLEKNKPRSHMTEYTY